MHKKLLLSALALVVSGALVRAESVNVTQVNVELSQEMIRAAVSGERRDLFSAALADLLTDSTVKSNFWAIYNAYEIERNTVFDARTNVVADYVSHFTTMSDVKIKELLKKSHTIQSKELKIRNKYANQLAKKVNATVAGRFWQVDDFISSAVKVSLLSQIPLLGQEIK